ncbi:MAG: FAD:protein FMN transferase [Chloroflexi bacterium]|nr:FAD:protein FMN transferase [Chloroflexota bacterium]
MGAGEMKAKNDTRKRSITRRDVLKIVAAAGASGFALHALQLDPRLRYSETRLLMGTLVNITLLGLNQADAREAASRSLDKMQALESVFSRFKPDSQVSVLNRDGALPAADAHLIELFAIARRISELTDGAYDITVKPLYDLYARRAAQSALPGEQEIAEVMQKGGYEKIQIDGQRVSFAVPGMAVTLDSIAKGYIVDAGIDVLRALGYTDVFLEAGGDLMAAGQREDRQDWSIGIRAPRFNEGGLQARMGVTNRAVATSGDYFQPFSADYSQHHILNPRTGRSAPDLASATVTAETVTWADGLATALMALGMEQARTLVESLAGVEAYLVGKDLNVWASSGFPLKG